MSKTLSKIVVYKIGRATILRIPPNKRGREIALT